MSLALRILTLALLFGWQAVAIGASGPAHFCPKQAEARSTDCHCPHGAVKAQTASHDEATLSMDCCDEPGWELSAPPSALADSSSHSSLLAVSPAPLPAWCLPRPAEDRRLVSLALWDTPHAQGPPVFLRTRSLLI